MAASDNQHGHRATHPRLHIRNAHEAHTLFEAVRLGLLPIVRRRLSPTDRELQSGEVFVWEEASYKGGLERWTDGRKWSQSRMREPFLFYEEKAMPSREEKDAKAARRARKSSDPSSPSSASPALPSSPSTPRRQDRPTKPKGLTKQTYSAFVHAPNATAGQSPKKWHLTAYFCSTTYHELPVCADDSVLRNVTVPENIYVTGKGLTRKNGSQRGVERKETPSSTPAPPSRPQAPVQQIPAPPQGYYHPPPPHHYAHPHDAPASSYAPAHPHAYPPPPQYAHHRPPPPPSETTSAPAEDGASTFDSGSRSPWSSSSSAMPVTPPPQPYSAYGPPTSYPPPPNSYGPPPSHHTGGYAPPYYAAPQPHYAPPGQPHTYVYDTAVPAVKAEPAVYDVTPRPASTLPPLPARYEEPPAKAPLAPPAKAPLAPPAAATLPPPAPQSYPGPTPSSSSTSSVLPNPSYPPPPPHTPFQPHYSATPGSAGSQYSPGHAQPVGYSTSDVRGEAPPSPTGSARSAGSATAGPRYSARHSLDQRALGAFKVTL